MLQALDHALRRSIADNNSLSMYEFFMFDHTFTGDTGGNKLSVHHLFPNKFPYHSTLYCTIFNARCLTVKDKTLRKKTIPHG